MKDFKKVINPVIRTTHTGREINVFCKIEYKDGKLSISGVEGPLTSGQCYGACGQIVMDWGKDNNLVGYGLNWTRDKEKRFLDIWERWHLNDMRAGCKHQWDLRWEDKRINPEELPHSRANSDEKGIMAMWVTQKEHKDGLLSKPCPVCGYKYGSKWLKEDVPEDVLQFLAGLPETTIQPAWC